MRALALLLLSAPAWAADHELSFDVGALVAPDDSMQTFDPDGGIVAMGVRAAFELSEHFAVHAGWSHSRTGSTLYYSDEEAGDTTSAQLAWFGNEVSAGPRFDWKLWGWFVPYARVDGLLLIADARLDDDPSDPASPGQQKEVALSGGVRPMAGIDFLIPRREGSGLTAGLYLEAGYSWLSTTKFETFGDVHLYGFTVRSGIGLRL